MRRRAVLIAIAVIAGCGGSDDDDSGRRGGTQEAAEGDDDRADRDDDDSDWAVFGVTPSSLPAAGEIALPAPAHRARCPEGGTSVTDAETLHAALAAAEPGDVIHLEPGTYAGNFVATTKATEADPIHLCGPAEAVLAGEGPKESGYVLHLDGAAYWRAVGLTVRDGRKGVMVDGGVGNVLQNLTVEHIGDEAIHVRTHSTDNLVLDNVVRDTGLRRDKFGEGIYVGSAQSNWCARTHCEPDRSDRNVIEGNEISATTSEAIDIKEGTVDGIVLANSFDGSATTAADSWVDVKGNNWLIAGNVGREAPDHGIQTHEIIEGWGSGNAFVANTLTVDAGGYGFDMHGPDDSNLVTCDNEVSGAGSGFGNEACR